jgi:hypothetical protein
MTPYLSELVLREDRELAAQTVDHGLPTIKSRLEEVNSLLPDAESGGEYPNLSPPIDILAFIVLLAALFMPLVRFGFRTMRFVDTDGLFRNNHLNRCLW